MTASSQATSSPHPGAGSSKASRNVSDDIEIVIASAVQLRFVLNNLTLADYEEVVAATGRGPLATIDDYPFSTVVALLKGEPVAVFGLGHDAGGHHPFLLTTPGVRGPGVARFMVQYGRNKMAQWFNDHGPLTNVVFTKNHAHLRFIRALGCTLGDTTKRGPLFQHFTEFNYVPPNARSSAGPARLGG